MIFKAKLSLFVLIVFGLCTGFTWSSPITSNSADAASALAQPAHQAPSDEVACGGDDGDDDDKAEVACGGDDGDDDDKAEVACGGDDGDDDDKSVTA